MSSVETQRWQIAISLLAAWQRERPYDAVLRKLAEVAAQGGTAAMIAAQPDDTTAQRPRPAERRGIASGRSMYDICPGRR